MKNKIEKYIKILKIELEDLEKDLLVMAEIYHQREQKKEITDYVFLENISLLQSEISGIDSIIESLEEINIEKLNTILFDEQKRKCFLTMELIEFILPKNLTIESKHYDQNTCRFILKCRRTS